MKNMQKGKPITNEMKVCIHILQSTENYLQNCEFTSASAFATACHI
ncbi:MAG: hypothetical protein ACI8RD_000528 [Bacillariaceae sp.]|jgi:hypothetical protein